MTIKTERLALRLSLTMTQFVSQKTEYKSRWKVWNRALSSTAEFRQIYFFHMISNIAISWLGWLIESQNFDSQNLRSLWVGRNIKKDVCILPSTANFLVVSWYLLEDLQWDETHYPMIGFSTLVYVDFALD